jgi:nucleoside-diphosphate-sugar epimerase
MNKRSLLGVENLADFLARCVYHHKAANEIFLLSDGEDVSTRELAARLAQVLGRSARFIPIPVSLMCLAGRLLQQDAAVSRLLGSLAINSGKARQMLGWTPPVTLDVGLAATVRWYLESPKQLE